VSRARPTVVRIPLGPSLATRRGHPHDLIPARSGIGPAAFWRPRPWIHA